LTNVIRIDGQPNGDDDGVVPATSMAALRLITGMNTDEFSRWLIPYSWALGFAREGT
jgi:hypothetical protein